MAYTATIVQVAQRHWDYTPSGADVAAGDVVVIGSAIGVAERPIADGVKGALAIDAVIQVPKSTGSGTAIAAGAKVYWDASGKVATETADSHKQLGTTVAAAADADATVLVDTGYRI